MQKSEGISPDLAPSDFQKQVLEKSPQFLEFANTILIPGDPKLGIQALRAGDIPLGLDQDSFATFINSRVADIKAKTRIDIENVARLPHSRELVSSVFIPPIAIALSLLSIILNLGGLLATFYRPFVLVPALAAMCLSFTASPIPNESIWVTRALEVEVKFAMVLSPYMHLIHDTFINDSDPPEANIIRLHKPTPVDFTSLEAQMEELSNSAEPTLPDDRVTVDTSKLKEAGYFGNVKVTKNPYQ